MEVQTWYESGPGFQLDYIYTGYGGGSLQWGRTGEEPALVREGGWASIVRIKVVSG